MLLFGREELNSFKTKHIIQNVIRLYKVNKFKNVGNNDDTHTHYGVRLLHSHFHTGSRTGRVARARGKILFDRIFINNPAIAPCDVKGCLFLSFFVTNYLFFVFYNRRVLSLCCSSNHLHHPAMHHYKPFFIFICL